MEHNTSGAQAFLESAGEAWRNIERVECRIKALQEKRNYFKGIKLPKSSAKLKKLLREYDDAIGQLIGDLRKARKQYKLASEFIDKLDNSVHREILRLHYLSGENLTEISNLIGYSRRHLTRVHNAALEAAEVLWAEIECAE